MRPSASLGMIAGLSATISLSIALGPVEAQQAGNAPARAVYTPLDALPNFTGTWTGGRRGGGPAGPGGGAPAGGGRGAGAAAGEDTVPLNAAGLAESERRRKLAADGKPVATVVSCLPRGGAAFWAGPGGTEIAFVPGRVLIWGALDHDGNNLRRIHTDGRQHSPDPDLTYLGESIGRWEGDTLVVDTVGFEPSVSAGLDIPNGGGMHIVERFRLTNPDTLQVEVEIEAPKALTRPYTFTRTLTRRTGREAETREIVCVTGPYRVDDNGLQRLNTTPPPDIQLPPGVTLK